MHVCVLDILTYICVCHTRLKVVLFERCAKVNEANYCTVLDTYLFSSFIQREFYQQWQKIFNLFQNNENIVII